MTAATGQELSIWLVRLTVVAYVGRLWIDCGGRPLIDRRFRAARLLWTVAALSLLAHIVTAMRWFHGGELSEAVRHTAEQTRAVTGWEFGGGVYLNFAFAAVWTVDAAHAWTEGRFRWMPGSRGYVVWQAVALFMVFNATVVFGPNWWKSWTLVVAGGFAARWWWQRRRRQR